MRQTHLLFICLIWAALTPWVNAQTPQPQLSCETSQWQVDSLQTYCEMREIPAAFVGSVNVDTSPIGNITIRGWDQPGVLIRAEVQTAAPDISAAAALASQVTVTANAEVIGATGPAQTSTGKWEVSYEIFVPYAADLTLVAKLGSVVIQNINGHIRCTASMGNISLDSVNGDVACQTSTGNVSIVLSGDHWDGQGLVVQTKTGNVDLALPFNYSAHVELSTRLGFFNSAIPMPVVKDGFAESVSTDLGAGGAPIRVSTKVGSVNVHLPVSHGVSDAVNP